MLEVAGGQLRRVVHLAVALLSLIVANGCRPAEQSQARNDKPRSVQLFNPDVLGRSTAEPVTLLLEKTSPDEVEPYVIWTDVTCGRYTGSTLRYLKPMTIANVRASINRRYASHANTLDSNLWRVETQRFAIHLIDDGDPGIKVIYLLFTPLSELKKAIREVQGSARMSAPDCAAWERALIGMDASEIR